MMRVRRPNKTERCLEWVDYLFWLIPIAIVALIVATQAVVIHFCLRVLRAIRGRHPECRQQQTIPIHAGIAADVPSPVPIKSRKAALTSSRAHTLCPASDFPIMLKRSGKGRFFRVSPTNLLSRDHVCAQSLSVPRFPGAKIPRGSDSRRF